MNLDEARGRLVKASAYLGADRMIEEAVSVDDMRDQLRVVFSQHADKPVIVQRLLQALLDEIVTDQTPGYNHPIVLVFTKLLRQTLDSVAFLAPNGFEEGAWFRASDALDAMGLYLAALEWAEQHPDDSVQPETPPELEDLLALRGADA
jgi:hypothetical protein